MTVQELQGELQLLLACPEAKPLVAEISNKERQVTANNIELYIKQRLLAVIAPERKVHRADRWMPFRVWSELVMGSYGFSIDQLVNFQTCQCRVKSAMAYHGSTRT